VGCRLWAVGRSYPRRRDARTRAKRAAKLGPMAIVRSTSTHFRCVEHWRGFRSERVGRIAKRYPERRRCVRELNGCSKLASDPRSGPFAPCGRGVPKTFQRERAARNPDLAIIRFASAPNGSLSFLRKKVTAVTFSPSFRRKPESIRLSSSRRSRFATHISPKA
jgi:hypothetical protein